MQKIYPLKVPSKIINKSGIVGIFLIGLAFFIEFVMNGFSFPQTLSLLARILLLSGFSLSILSASFLLFHRKKATILLDDQGIHLPGYEKIREEINLKYCELLKNEKNPFKRLYFQVKQQREITRAIGQLTSLDKLYLHT